jgi:hypothetical protein
MHYWADCYVGFRNMYTLLVSSLGITKIVCSFYKCHKTIKRNVLVFYEALSITSYKLSVLKILRWSYNSLNYQEFCGTWRVTAISIRTTSCQLGVWCPLDWFVCKPFSLDSDKDCYSIIRCLISYFQCRMWTEIILQRVPPDTQYFSCVRLHVQV